MLQFISSANQEENLNNSDDSDGSDIEMIQPFEIVDEDEMESDSDQEVGQPRIERMRLPRMFALAFNRFNRQSYLDEDEAENSDLDSEDVEHFDPSLPGRHLVRHTYILNKSFSSFTLLPIFPLCYKSFTFLTMLQGRIKNYLLLL